MQSGARGVSFPCFTRRREVRSSRTSADVTGRHCEDLSLLSTARGLPNSNRLPLSEPKPRPYLLSISGAARTVKSGKAPTFRLLRASGPTIPRPASPWPSLASPSLSILRGEAEDE